MRDVILAIETSNPTAPSSSGGGGAGSVCVGRISDGKSEILACEVLSAATRHDDALMPAVAAVCARAGIVPSGLARVAVSIGPGGFTSLRIAVTTAKMICEATGAACIGVPTALALALAARAHGTRGTLGVLLAWKREDVWRQRYDLSDDGVRAIDPNGTIVGLDTASAGCAVVVAEAALRDMLAVPAGVSVIEPRFDARWVLEASAGLTAVDPALLVPIYPREPEAVTKWRALHGAARSARDAGGGSAE
ncbi:MAG: tRNA (adenosine(37)-N6)-threonylcarbamoyltransferase complex dimerization subunit type 1 TsaB [Phycisphaerales bacterium]